MKLRKWLGGLLNHASPVCKDVVRWASLEAEQPLPWHRKLQMHAHLLVCEFCKRYREQLITLRTVLRNSPEKLIDSESTPLSPDAKQRIKDALRDKSS